MTSIAPNSGSSSYFDARHAPLSKSKAIIVNDYGGVSYNAVSQTPDFDSAIASYRDDGSVRPTLDILPGENSGTRSGRPVSFIEPVHGHASSYRPTFSNRFKLFLAQILCFVLSSVFLVVVVTWALLADLSARIPSYLRAVEATTFPWDDPNRLAREKCVKDVRYYARAAGFDIVDEEVETEDGFYLR